MFDFNTLPKKIQNNLYCKYRQKDLMLHTLHLCKQICDERRLCCDENKISIEEIAKIRSEYLQYIRKHNIFELLELERISFNSQQSKTKH
jgi:hypothetical protein